MGTMNVRSQLTAVRSESGDTLFGMVFHDLEHFTLNFVTRAAEDPRFGLLRGRASLCMSKSFGDN